MAPEKRTADSNKKSSRIIFRNQRGFSFIALLTLLPLLLSVLVVYASVAFALRQHTLTAATCREVVWRAQNRMAQLLAQLLKLNSQATHLRQQRHLAELKVRMARATAYPPAIMAAEAKRALVLQKQLVLKSKQQFLLAHAGQIRTQASHTYLRRIKSHASVKNVLSRSGCDTLAVEAIPAHDLTPSYRLANNFSFKQQISLHFGGDLFSHMPIWLLNQQNVKGGFKNSCGATLQTKGELWQPALAKARL